MQSSEPITVAVADDHQLIRHSLSMLINSMDGYTVVAEAVNGKDLIEQIGKLKEDPVLAFIDVSMPVMDGFDTMKFLNAHYPHIRCIGLSVHGDFNTVFRMISSGAKAYLLKDCSPQQMQETMEKVVESGFYYDSFVVESLMDYQKQRSGDEPSPESMIAELSERETEFISHCCSELAYKEIASLMNISPRTVDGYRESVFSKLNVKSRVGIVLFAIRNNMYSPVAN